MKKALPRPLSNPAFRHWLAFIILGCLAHPVCAEENDFMENRWVSILSAYPDFSDALKDAEKIANQAKIPFSMESRVYDKKRGLIYPDDFQEDIFAGGYVARSHNETEIEGKISEFLSIERSDGYDGFRKGYYIVIAGIYESADAAKKQSERFKKWAPTSYAKRTRIYLGCMH